MTPCLIERFVSRLFPSFPRWQPHIVHAAIVCPSQFTCQILIAKQAAPWSSSLSQTTCCAHQTRTVNTIDTPLSLTGRRAGTGMQSMPNRQRTGSSGRSLVAGRQGSWWRMTMAMLPRHLMQLTSGDSQACSCLNKTDDYSPIPARRLVECMHWVIWVKYEHQGCSTLRLR